MDKRYVHNERKVACLYPSEESAMRNSACYFPSSEVNRPSLKFAHSFRKNAAFFLKREIVQ